MVVTWGWFWVDGVGVDLLCEGYRVISHKTGSDVSVFIVSVVALGLGPYSYRTMHLVHQ